MSIAMSLNQINLSCPAWDIGVVPCARQKMGMLLELNFQQGKKLSTSFLIKCTLNKIGWAKIKKVTKKFLTKIRRWNSDELTNAKIFKTKSLVMQFRFSKVSRVNASGTLWDTRFIRDIKAGHLVLYQFKVISFNKDNLLHL